MCIYNFILSWCLQTVPYTIVPVHSLVLPLHWCGYQPQCLANIIAPMLLKNTPKHQKQEALNPRSRVDYYFS